MRKWCPVLRNTRQICLWRENLCVLNICYGVSLFVFNLSLTVEKSDLATYEGLSLAKVIENHSNYRLLVDNFFPSNNLFKVLKNREIYTTCTVWQNRVDMYTLVTSVVLNSKKARESWE